MALPQLPQVSREQAITDMIEALALQEAAIASVIHAEAAKIDGLVEAGIPCASNLAEVESYQAKVVEVLKALSSHKADALRMLDALLPKEGQG